jgi:hypothetical protein
MLTYEVIEQTQSELEKTQITTISAMDDLDPVGGIPCNCR